jgi:glycosyltransferase involved in cell wall biosynthesis
LKKIDILFYLYGMDGGGAERHVLYLLQRLDRARFSPRLFLESADGPYLHKVPADVPVENMYKSFEDRGRRLPYWREVKLVAALGRYIRKHPPDLIYGRMYTSALAAGLASWWAGSDAPLVASEAIFPSVGILPDLGGYSPLRLYLVKKVQRDISRVIVCPAAAMIEDCAAFYGCPRSKMRVIPNGVDIEAMDRARSEAPSHPWAEAKTPLVIGMGRLCSQKGFDVLLRAFSLVSRKISEARLLVLGKGEDGPRLAEEVSALGLRGRVDFPGWLPNPHAVISRAAVFVLSSRYEGFPNGVLEAMSCGTPVVATDCPSGPREILDGGAGILVPVDDSKAMADALGNLLEDPGLRVAMASRGRARVEERYSLPGMVAAYECLFEEVAGRSPGDGLRADRKIPEMSSSSSV